MPEEERTLTKIIENLIDLSKNLEPRIKEKEIKKKLIEQMKESIYDIWNVSTPDLKRSILLIECAVNQINIKSFNEEQLTALLKSFSLLEEEKENSRKKITLILASSNLRPIS